MLNTLPKWGWVGAGVLALAAGLQNAMVSNYSGAIIRTTHLTGVLTDLGVLIGHLLQGLKVDKARLKLFISILRSFILGGVAGAFFYRHWLGYAMFVPAGVIGFAALFYEMMRRRFLKN